MGILGQEGKVLESFIDDSRTMEIIVYVNIQVRTNPLKIARFFVPREVIVQYDVLTLNLSCNQSGVF